MEKSNFLLRIPQDLKEWYRVEAERRGVTLTALILQVLWMFKQEQPKEKRYHKSN